MLFQDKVALVTGGASGIGRASALAFAREGARVAVSDVAEEGGRETVDLIAAEGGDAVFIRADMRVGTEVDVMVEAVVERYGRLDCAFNNAGWEGRATNVVDCTEEEWEAVMAINLTSVWRCMKREIPHMLRQGGGAIVNTSSGLGLAAMPNMAAYITSKHALVGLTRSAALDFAAQNIRVNVLHPGPTMTPTFEAAVGKSGLTVEDLGARVPIGRVGLPEEQAEAVIWLCSDKASFIAGAQLVVDGGVAVRR